MNLAPVALFTFKRVDTLQKTINSLLLNKEAEWTDLFVFSDAGRNEKEIALVSRVREYIEKINGFRSVTLIFSSENKGLAASIIDGIGDMLEKYDSTIILEDDLVVSTNFLSFMNQALSFYKNSRRVLSICGYSSPIGVNVTYKFDTYFTYRSSSWGWATWKNRWDEIDWAMKDYDSFIKDKKAQRKFNLMGSDMTHMLKKQDQGKINSWAIRFCFHQFRYQLFSVHPVKSKVINIGLNSKEATHTNGMTARFKTNLDTSDTKSFIFEDSYILNHRIIKKFVQPYSLKTRIKYKILNLIK
ncbi:glycosyltransferase [Jiulongibacter sp. NS-SX5]|uniref:glycosyltransferase n=1 Tax=Jiulongibacter sp. NS-SX5 TaxID=3463854 RepID=UPI004058646E